MIAWFKQLLLLEKFVLVFYVMGILSWVFLFQRDTKAWWIDQCYVKENVKTVAKSLVTENLLQGGLDADDFVAARVPTPSFLKKQPKEEETSVDIPAMANRISSLMADICTELSWRTSWVDL